ncbi:ABC transporter ATP-binding protein [Aliiruegeria lutimaris]|uniref:Putative ABC transport system ATP-binding protein n=1 Tax=Aliiruegeria lutimaris TaxID=571298 RepID=A0A1G9LXF6_9RHOB|nr:ATP-binding cassette domain-containing protein [Aliiruegeria lutimaris]SDL66669.1 putative ABC transport system ATP-binding protein [Aliiruegeria lutimaris]
MTMPLSVTDCVVRSDRGRVLLSVPSLELGPGVSLGIRGPSGAGKSTLLYALAGLSDRAEGSIRWGDTELLALSTARRTQFRAAWIGMIFQDFLLFDELGALANASLPAMFAPRSDRSALKTRAGAQLAHLGITALKRTVDSFSGGERQRVAVARALSNDAGILLADEPTASLNRDAADALIADLVAKVRNNGKTLIAVSHDAHLLDSMDQIISLTDGQIETPSGARPA